MQQVFKTLILLFTLAIISNSQAQCNANAGIPFQTINNYVNGVNNPSDLIITNYVANPSGASNYQFIITEGVGQDSEIVGFSNDGSWDFENAIDGQEYCFHQIAFNQYELDFITNNSTMQSLLASGCLSGNESLEEFNNCFRENFPDFTSIDNIFDSLMTVIVPQIIPEFIAPNPPPCFDIAEGNEVFCITYLDSINTCPSIQSFSNSNPSTNLIELADDKIYSSEVLTDDRTYQAGYYAVIEFVELQSGFDSGFNNIILINGDCDYTD